MTLFSIIINSRRLAAWHNKNIYSHLPRTHLSSPQLDSAVNVHMKQCSILCLNKNHVLSTNRFLFILYYQVIDSDRSFWSSWSWFTNHTSLFTFNVFPCCVIIGFPVFLHAVPTCFTYKPCVKSIFHYKTITTELSRRENIVIMLVKWKFLSRCRNYLI